MERFVADPTRGRYSPFQSADAIGQKMESSLPGSDSVPVDADPSERASAAESPLFATWALGAESAPRTLANLEDPYVPQGGPAGDRPLYRLDLDSGESPQESAYLHSSKPDLGIVLEVGTAFYPATSAGQDGARIAQSRPA